MLNISITQYLLYPDHGNARSSNLHALQGWHIQVTDPETKTFGIGDALVWPQFGLTNDQVEGDLRHFEQQCLQLDVHAMLAWSADADLVSAARYGIELACLDLLAKSNQQSLAKQLWSSADSSVSCHQLIGSIRQAASERRAHLGAVKLKVGVHDLSEELDFIEKLCMQEPTRRIRLDANGSWSFDEARRVCDRLSQYQGIILEQPIDPRDLLGLDKLQQQTSMTIALDESLVFDEEGALQTACKQCVIKPMYMGGLRASKAVVARAQALKKSLCVTHVLESAIGRAGAVHFAAGVGDKGPHGVADPKLNSTEMSIAGTIGHGASK